VRAAGEQLAVVGQLHLPHQRVERDEQRIGCRGVRRRQPIEQRRLARVRVSHECNGGDRLLLAALAQLRATLPDLIDFALYRLDPRADAAPIRFQFCFTGATCADAAAEPRQHATRAYETRQQVLELRELDLPLAFARACSPREDVENELRPIDHLPFQLLFELTELRGRELVVDDHHIDVGFGACGRERRHLAAADECRGIWFWSLLQHADDDVRAGSIGETGEFIERPVGIDAACAGGDEPNEGSPFGPRGRTAIGHSRGAGHVPPRGIAEILTYNPTAPDDPLPAAAAAAHTDHRFRQACRRARK
jgi:hypothetical protein